MQKNIQIIQKNIEKYAIKNSGNMAVYPGKEKEIGANTAKFAVDKNLASQNFRIINDKAISKVI